MSTPPARKPPEVKIDDRDIPDDLTVFSEADLISFIDTYLYRGFDRKKVREQAKAAVTDKNITVIAAASALRGPKKAAALMKTPIPANGHKGEEVLTCAKILAAFPERAASVLKRIPNLNKRIPSSPVPAFLQFPSAASLPLDRLRPGLAKEHKDWARLFSKLLPGGEFREDLYDLTASDSVELTPALVAQLKSGL
jgi:hypothetical protein